MGKNKIKLKSCKMYKEDGKYYLDLKYTIEKIDGIYEKHIPKVVLPIPTDSLSISKEYVGVLGCEDLIFGRPHRIEKLLLNSDQFLYVEDINGIYDTEILVEKKTRKMTLAEIEKELGYSVEVVSKK